MTSKISSQALFTTPTAAATLVKATPVQELGAMHTYVRRYLYVQVLIIENDVVDPAFRVIKKKKTIQMINGDQGWIQPEKLAH